MDLGYTFRLVSCLYVCSFIIIIIIIILTHGKIAIQEYIKRTQHVTWITRPLYDTDNDDNVPSSSAESGPPTNIAAAIAVTFQRVQVRREPSYPPSSSHHGFIRSPVWPTTYIWQSRAGNYPGWTVRMMTDGSGDDPSLISAAAAADSHFVRSGVPTTFFSAVFCTRRLICANDPFITLMWTYSSF